MQKLYLLLLMTGLLATGCGRSDSEGRSPGTNASAPVKLLPVLADEPLLRVHWAGIKALRSDTNAAHFLSIWDMPETARLREQTLGKLASAPWRLLPVASTNAAPELLRPLLEDILQEECYLEMRYGNNAGGELVFAIRLKGDRASLWHENLAQLLGVRSHTGIARLHEGIQWTNFHGSLSLQLRRVNEWVLLGVVTQRDWAMAQLVEYFATNSASPVIWSPKYWLEAQAEPELLALATQLPPGLAEWLPACALSVRGEADEVRLDGELNFAQPVPLILEPWNVPTNLLGQPLSSFAAVRGMRPLLNQLRLWHELELGTAWNQAFCWALQGLPMESYYAIPSNEASNQVAKITDYVLRLNREWTNHYDLMDFGRGNGGNGLEWRGLPYMWPFLRTALVNGQSFVLGGLFTYSEGNHLSPEALHEPLSVTNLLYHGWEATGIRMEQWTYIGQFARLVTKRPQLSSSGLAWLRAVAGRASNSVTQITLTAPNQLTFVRKGTLGLEAAELHLLVDWLESPEFPLGLHSLRSPTQR